MIHFILNNQTIETDLPEGLTVLDFVRYRKNLKGTKIGCREGDCGACTVLVGELSGDVVRYRTQTSCLMPLANAQNKHIVSVEGINKPDGELTEVQQALVENGGTQCGFCTVGFVMSLTGFCVDETPKNAEMAVSAVDGNICRCTGYKSIERAAVSLLDGERGRGGEGEKGRRGEGENGLLERAISRGIVPEYFSSIKDRLTSLISNNPKSEIRNPKSDKSKIQNPKSNRSYVGGGTDLYVQHPEEMAAAARAENLFDNAELRTIEESVDFVEVGASATVTDLLVSPVFQGLFPDLFRHLKLVSSTPIRNMATLGGNFVNASPIGDMTVWFLALDAEIALSEPSAVADGLSGATRMVPLKDLFLGYKQLAKKENEFITKIRFRKGFSHFNFEKVCKRTFLDIASVNTAISLKSEPSADGLGKLTEAHVAAGGVAPIPLYLRKTSAFLKGREISEETVLEAGEILQAEISPISDVRGTKEYKRLLLRQLFTAHFVELFGIHPEKY